MIRTIAICLAIACSKAFVLDDPCNIDLQIGQYLPNVTSIRADELVPHGCVNGTIQWMYSRGLGRVHFLNQHHRSMTMCFTGCCGWFTENGDITNESPDIPMIRPRDDNACTTQSTSINLILQLQAPQNLLFRGYVYYWVKQ